MSVSDARRSVIILVLLAWAFAPGDVRATEPYEFRKAAEAPACVNLYDPNDQARPYFDCLKIGPVYVGLTLRDVAMKFGKASKEVRQGGQILRVYPIRLQATPGAPLPYWVIGFEGQRVVSVQLTGDRAVTEFPFSSIHIGEPAARVIEVLGEPAHKQAAPNISGEMWIYSPLPVTFEIKNGRVYTMRVAEAVGK